MVLCFNDNVMDVVTVVMFYLVIISDATKKFSMEKIKIYSCVCRYC